MPVNTRAALRSACAKPVFCRDAHVSSLRGVVSAQMVEHHSAQPTLQAPHRFRARVAFGSSALVVVPAGTIEAQLDYGDAVDGGIDLSIA